MKKVRLIELFEFRTKSKLQAGVGVDQGQYPFYTSSPVLSKYFDKYQFEGEHLILGTGGSASIHYNRNRFAVSSDCVVLKPINRELFHPKFIYYYFLSNLNILESGFRGAGLKHISKAYIANLNVPLPSYNIQTQVVAVFDKVFTLKQHIEDLNKKLDELERSVYFSIFGTRSQGYANWPIIKLEDLTIDKKNDLRTGPFGM